MARKILTAVFLFAVLLVTAGPLQASALQAQTKWEGSGTSSYSVVNGDLPTASLTYNVSGYSGDWWLNTTAGATGPVTLSYTYTGFHSWCRAEAYVWAFVEHNSVYTWTLLQYDKDSSCNYGYPSGGFSYDGTVELNVEEGDTYGFLFGGSHYDGTEVLSGTFSVNSSGMFIQPAVKYKMWLLTKDDGTACLLKSASHPSVASQNQYCFPEEYNNSWTADHMVCSGDVDEYDFWACAAEYIAWQEQGK